jgi:undecaprenyl-diphosphatase
LLHHARIAHRALRAGNILVADGRPVVVDLGFAEQSAGARLLAIDRAELLASLALLVGAQPVIASAKRVIGSPELASTMPYLQPLALSAATRAKASKAMLKELREGVAEATGEQLPPIEQLVRVKPRAVLTVAALTAAFYLLLPQLADAEDSFAALKSANWAWFAVCLLLSAETYAASTISLMGGVRARLPFVATVTTQMASSFVNRITPANVGGMALNVRFMQKASVPPAEAVSGMGLSVLAGGIVHAVLLVAFFTWAGRSGSEAFALPSSSRILVVIAVLLAVAGVLAATRWGRRVFERHVLRFLRQSWASIASLARSPFKLAMLFGGSFGVTLGYICALAAAMAAFDVDVSFAQVGAVYLGSSLIAAAAPTPSGLGAMEAALVAGFTGVGVDAGVAVAAVLSYRVATYWLPILPGWLSFHLLERRNLI